MFFFLGSGSPLVVMKDTFCKYVCIYMWIRVADAVNVRWQRGNKGIIYNVPLCFTYLSVAHYENGLSFFSAVIFYECEDNKNISFISSMIHWFFMRIGSVFI